MEYRYIGVITGDLVSSQNIYERGFTYKNVLTTLLKEVGSHDWYNISKVEFFRGDSFQITLESPQAILEIAAFIRTYLISLTDVSFDEKLDARLSLSIEILNRYTANPDKVYEQAYIQSGKNLEIMPASRKIVFNSTRSNLMLPIAAMAAMLDNTITMLSKQQAEVLKESLDVMVVDVPKLVKKTGKTRQNIHKIIERSGTDKVVESLLLGRTYITGIL